MGGGDESIVELFTKEQIMKKSLKAALAAVCFIAAGAFFMGCSSSAGGDFTPKYAVGDIVLNDGTKVAYSVAKDYAGDDLTNLKKNAIAVIFRADTASKKALGVGLKHNTSGRVWCNRSAKAYDKNIKTIQCPPSGEAGDLTFTGDTDGSDNLNQIASFLTKAGLENDTSDASEYPAFYFAKKYKLTATNLTAAYEKGWYLPTVAELFDIWEVKATVNAASRLCEGSEFDSSCYW